jgi:hypothetical protein
MPTFFDIIASTILEIMVGISSLFPWFKKRNEKGKRRLRDLTFAGTIGIAIIIWVQFF